MLSHNAAPMVLLTRLEGSLTLAKVLFGSPDIVSTSFDPSNHNPVARDCMAKGLIEGLVAWYLFLIAAAAHRQGYLEKIAQGQITNAEKEDYRAIVLRTMTVLHQGFREFDAVVPNLRDHPYATAGVEQLQWWPIPVRVASTNATRFNNVWLERSIAAAVKAELAARHAAGATGR